MTLIVGIRCDDGVVLAADSAATFSTGQVPTIGQIPVPKVLSIGRHGLIAFTGSVGTAQEAHTALEREFGGQTTGWSRFPDPTSAMSRTSEVFHDATVQRVRRAANFTPEVQENARCQALMAFVVGGKPFLCQLDEAGNGQLAQRDLPFVALGIGQQNADPFLAFLHDLLWRKPRSSPSLPEARLVAAWTISHGVRYSPGGVGGSHRIGSLSVGPAGEPVVREDESVAEHMDAIDAVENGLKGLITGILDGRVDDVIAHIVAPSVVRTVEAEAETINIPIRP